WAVQNSNNIKATKTLNLLLSVSSFFSNFFIFSVGFQRRAVAVRKTRLPPANKHQQLN
ncbi:hypothetical protein M5D96_013004, partial [Drosophila gunungcola]